MKQLIQDIFGDCKFPDTDCNGSFENTNLFKFHVCDPPPEHNKPAKIVSDIDEYQLTVINNNGHNIWFVKTDKCLLENDKSKCDCLLFSDEIFCFVEIKNSKSSSRSTQRAKAIEQLEATIINFKGNGINFSHIITKAIICFNSNNDYPIQASKKTQQAIFAEKYQVSLEEGNKIEF